MNFNDLSDEEKKKYLDGFKQYVAERQGKKVESNEVVNSVINDMYYGTNTREKYFMKNNNTNNIWGQVQDKANNNMTNTDKNNSILFKDKLIGQENNKTNTNKPKNIMDLTLNKKEQNLETDEELIKSLANIDNVEERAIKIRGLVKDKDEQSKLILKVNEYRQQQESQGEAQKINSDIQQGNYLSSVGHVLKGLPEEALNATINTAVTLENIIPVKRASSDSNAKGHVDAAKIITNKYQDTTSQINNGVVQTASNVSGTIGQMIPSMLANLIAPGTGNLVQAVNVGSSGYLDALNENQDNKGKAVLTGALKGATSYGIEKLTGGNFLSGGSLDDIAKKAIKSNISSDVGRRIASKVYEIGGETLEENLENQAGYVIDKLVNNKNISSEQWLNDLGTTSRDTVLTTIVLNLFGLGGNTYKEIQNDENIDSNTKELVKKAEKIIKDENLSVDNVNQAKIVETTNTPNNINNNSNAQTNNIFQQQNQNNIDTSNLNFEDSARAYNLDTNNETIKTVNQVLSNRDISGRFDASYFNNNNENAIWRTYTDENGNTKREVIFNPNGNTQDTMQQISIHELTHDLAGTKEFEELKSLVLDRNKTMQGHTEARQSLENTYSQVYDPNSKNFKSLVDEEEVADTLAQKLGNQDFVNSLSTEKPTVFKRIYDWVVDKVNKITGNKIEKVYWEDIRNKFENAYRQTYKGGYSQDKYSIQKDSNGNQYVKVDTDQDIFEGKDVKDYPKIAKQYILSKFRDGDKNINLPTREDVTVTSKTAREYTHPKKQLPQKVKESKMKASTELDNLISISEYQYSRPDDGRHEFAKDGWDYYKTRFEIDGNTFEGLVNIAKSGNKKTLYDITNIKRINQNHSASAEAFSTSLVNSNNSITPSQDNVNTINQSMQKEENNTLNVSSKKLTDKQRQNRLEYLRNVDTSSMKFLEKHQIKSEIRALENGYNSVEEMRKVEKESKQETVKESENNSGSFNLSKKTEVNKIKPDGSITMTYVRNPNNKTQDYGSRYGQDLEPAGEYMSMDTMQGKYKVPGFEYGTIDFKRPLVLEHKDTTANGWKKDLSEKYGGLTGKKLSNAIKKDGYDAIMTKDEDGNFVEIVNLDGQKNNNDTQSNINNKEKTYKEKQLDIIQKANPMADDYHTGIRTVDDIQTFKEAYEIAKKEANDGGWEEYASYPDITNEMIENSLRTGEITVYSSNDIKNGAFVTPSYEQALEYAGNDDSKVKNKKVKVDDVAWINLDEGQYAKIDKNNNQSKLSMQQSSTWQEFLNNQIGKRGEGKTVQELKLPTRETINNNINIPINKTLNPTEIANLKLDDASTTPKLPNRKYVKGNKQSSFFSNVVTDSEFLNKDLRQEIGNDEAIKYYNGITNKETLEKSYKELQDGGAQEVLSWFSKDGKNATAEDVTKGWILLKQYQDSGDYASAVEVAKKMRDIGTKAGQTVQAFNILSRLTPEGMTLYAQKELSEAYDQMVKGKSQKWIDENASNFDLSPNEIAFIKETMEKVSSMEDGYDKKVKLAEIQKLITDKIPPTKGQGIKAWMRISMLFNPKTQVRNVAGNAVILPVNMFSDSVSAGVDRLISKKTGVRTTGNTNIKNYAKGFGKGLYESYNDFRKGINTRNIEENRFEVGEGKNFKDKGIGKSLNRVDGLLSFMLDAGDRGFYEATFNNSINNQMVLNGTSRITQDMVDIATTEALQRTWQDSNTYTKFVLGIRNWLNKINAKGYGLGDVLIPFAKTPANLTKAIVDYSPVGLVKTLSLDAKRFKNAIDTGQYIPQMQHKFVQDIGKGFAGTFLYVAGYALAKAGIITGEADDDKDVKNFMKNSLGISSYSVKIGDKTFSYDWAQPVATPFAIMSNFVKYDNENPDANAIEKGINALNIGTEQLLEQSFMESLNTVLNGNGTITENLAQAVFDLPARAIPTFCKQIADMVDGTQRTSFEYDQPIKSAINSVIAKIPIASKNLAPSRDTLGNDIQKYGGENNFFNVFINPANTNKGKMTKAGQEIYNLYQETGEARIFPITAPYYINNEGEKIVMDSNQRAKYQKITGDYTEKAIDELLQNNDYKKLNNSEKVDLIADIITDSNARAKYEVLGVETEEAKEKREYIDKIGTKAYYDYEFKTKDIEGENENKEKMSVLEKSNYSDNIKSVIYTNTTGKKDTLYTEVLKDSGININKYLQYKQQEFESDKEDDGTLKGKSKNNKKEKVYNYVNNMDITYDQKLLILGKQYKLTDAEQKKLYQYINNIPGQTSEEKLEIFKMYTNNFQIYKNGTMSFK